MKYTFSNNKFEVLLSLYSGLGIGVFVIMHSIASKYQSMIDFGYFIFNYEDALIIFPIVTIVLFILILAILIIIKKNLKKIMLIWLSIIFISYLTFSNIDGGLNGYNIIYIFSECIFVTMILIIYSHFSEKKLIKKDIKKKKIYKDYLKLEHKEILEYIHIISYLGVIFIISAFVTTLYQTISNIRTINSAAVGLLLLDHFLLFLYFIIGYSIGILGQLFMKLKHIRIEFLQIS